MHTYPMYTDPGVARVWELMSNNPFAVVVSHAGGEHTATHLPLIPAPGSFPDLGAGSAAFAGLEMWGHLGRANLHWRAWSDGCTALAVLSSHTAYISPTLYGTDPSVPTMNYAAVHLHGTIDLLPRERVRDVLDRTVDFFEADRPCPWDARGSTQVFDNLAQGVVAFRFTVRRAEWMFKLGQNLRPEIHRRVVDALREQDPALRDLMKTVGTNGMNQEY